MPALVTPASNAYIAGMQYTLRNVPPALDRALRALAEKEGRSLNETAIAALGQALGLGAESVRYRALEDLAGTWQDDGEFDSAIQDQHTIDPDLWR